MELHSPQILWEEERKKLKTEEKQSFVDLGCGNGLLVYLLTSEGVRESKLLWFAMRLTLDVSM